MSFPLDEYDIVSNNKTDIKIIAPFVPGRVDGFAYIYALVDPRDHLPRYIGRSINPQKRMVQHFGCKSPGMTEVNKWINELKSLGLVPYAIISETPVNDTDAIEAEERWIWLFTSLGAPLINLQVRRQRAEIKEILWEITNGIAYREIALKHNFTVSMIEKIAKGILYVDVTKSEKRSMYGRGGVHRKGDKNGRAKLNSDQVNEIRKLLAQGYSCKHIGQEFGVSSSLISHIKTRRNWI